jgi:adenylate cyclase
MALNPNDVRLIANRGTFEIFTGRPDVALTLFDEAERRDPQLPNWFWGERGHALYHLRRYADAAAAFERVTAAPVYVDRLRAACYAQLDRIDEARAIAAEALRREPRFTLRRNAMMDPFQSRADLDHMLEGLRKAGLPE